MFNFIIDYNITYHCNLNCSGCNHFCPLVKESKYADIDNFINNIFRLKEIFRVNEHRIDLRLVGGEPLLHPEIKTFMTYAREILPESVISIYTNGIYLSDNIRKLADANNIQIYVSNYHLSGLENIYRKSNLKEKADFKYKYLSTVNDMSRSACRFKTHDSCCSSLDWNGNFHLCGITETIHYLNEYYGYSFNIAEGEDFVNIYDRNITYASLLKMKIRNRPFCGYCRKAETEKWKQFDGENTWIQDMDVSYSDRQDTL